MDEGQAGLMDLLRPLVGKWRGTGVAQFPTIPTLQFREELEFGANNSQPLLHYEQRTWKQLETREFVPSHWETGFWRVLSETEIELVCAQSGGRVEVSRGPIRRTSDGFVLRLESTLVAGDPRMGQTMREYSLQGNTFRHSMDMSTTAVPGLTPHVHADLVRSDGREGNGKE